MIKNELTYTLFQFMSTMIVISRLIFPPLGLYLYVFIPAEIILMIMGILSIQSGDNPRIVEQKLNSFIAPNLRKLREEK